MRTLRARPVIFLQILRLTVLLNRFANVCSADDVLQREGSNINGDEGYTLTG